MRVVTGFFRFWWDFIVGDDGWIAVGVTLVLGLGAAIVGTELVADTVVAPLIAAAIVAVVLGRVLAGARSSR